MHHKLPIWTVFATKCLITNHVAPQVEWDTESEAILNTNYWIHQRYRIQWLRIKLICSCFWFSPWDHSSHSHDIISDLSILCFLITYLQLTHPPLPTSTFLTPPPLTRYHIRLGRVILCYQCHHHHKWHNQNHPSTTGSPEPSVCFDSPYNCFLTIFLTQIFHHLLHWPLQCSFISVVLTCSHLKQFNIMLLSHYPCPTPWVP